MLGLARSVFGEFDEKGANLFFGYKTEVVSSTFMRNYLYHIVERGAYTIALPGKFTLCFSLTEMSVWSILSLWSLWSIGFRVAWTPGDFHDCLAVGIEPAGLPVADGRQVERVELKDEEVGHYMEQPMHYRLARQLAMRGG